MSKVPTPHIGANVGEIADTVLMPGDPLRAKVIADQFLEEVIPYNTVRGMLGFTGIYKGKRVSVQGSGMGIPSIGIYSYELFNFYDVKRIIRIGSAGALSDDLNLNDLVIAQAASTNSNYGHQFNLPGQYASISDYELLNKAVETAKAKQLKFRVGNILSNDIFYDDQPDALDKWKRMGILAVEMEAAGLFMNAARASKAALCILTISDVPAKGLATTAEERQHSFTDMMEVALEIA